MTEDTSSHGRDGVTASGYGRRRFIAVGSGVGAALLAGCTSDDSGGDGTPTDDGGDGAGGGETANFRLLVSDAPADIDDFDRLDVTFSQARVFEGGDEEGEGTETEGGDEEGTETEGGDGEETATDTVEEDQQQTGDDENSSDAENGSSTENGTATETDAENGTDDDGTETDEGSEDGEGGRGFYVLDLDDPTVDLTQVVGDKAQPIFGGELEAGSYQKLELHVADVEGVVDSEAVEVKVPSNKLQLTKPFEVRAGEELDFVFDINVVKRGNQASYNLKPVISQSGVRGEDVEVEEVDEDGEGDDEQGAGSDDGGGSNGTDDEGGAGESNETGGTDDDGAGGNETGGNETGGNESAA